MLIYVAIGAAAVWSSCACPPPSCPTRTRAHAGERAAAAGRHRRAHAHVVQHGLRPQQPEVKSMVGVLGWLLGQGQNAALAFVTLKPGTRAGRSTAQALAGAPSARCGHPRCLHLPAEPAADPGWAIRGHLPPAGPRRPGHEALIARATSCWAWPARARCCPGAPGRPGRRAAAADRHRPRQGPGPGRAFSTINSAVDRAGLGL
jgi:hypothetical protein